MQIQEVKIIKRDGKTEDFSIDKISNAIRKAYAAGGVADEGGEIARISERVASTIDSPSIGVEEIQDRVERELMLSNPYIAKKYILYRQWRNTERDKRTSMKTVMDGIVAIEKNDINLGNANMSSHTPAGQMMTFASEVTKDYALKYLVGVKYARAHRDGDIHIHDLDYYPTKTTTCIQYDLEDIFGRGFHTKNGSIRTPQSIQSYATLATIVFQTNQNEQHGGQSIPALDFFLAPGVRKSFVKHVCDGVAFCRALAGAELPDAEKVKKAAFSALDSIEPKKAALKKLSAALSKLGAKMTEKELSACVSQALENTRKDTRQAMEGFVHNLNTMHSR
ncbi:MAG: anaerobic ribonucleoside triphosphate reductase, partial [Opitutales bacterium]|nr:anaerobic ribonucleoside triphosphate reductase [Opitutales bacterium]